MSPSARFPCVAWFSVMAVICGVLMLPASGAAETLRLEAPRLWRDAVVQGLRAADDGRSISLDEGVLVEDDGPAAGFSYKPNTEKLTASVWVKKELLVGGAKCRRATLLVAPGGELSIEVNGRLQNTGEPRKVHQYWQAYELHPAALVAGKNEIVLHGTGQLWIARDDEYAAGSTTRTAHPNRSAKSTDGGKTWDDRHLGMAGDVDGEYYVRLYLLQHQAEGKLTTPVFDAGNLTERTISPPVGEVGSIQITARGQVESSGRIQLRARTGSTYIPDEKHWSAWQTISTKATPLAGTIEKPAGRYVQIEAILATDDPLSAPALSELILEANPKLADDWAQAVRVSEEHNPPVIRTSIPFTYEPFDQPQLARLRKEHQLDELVAGAKDELEVLSRLAVWSSARWLKIGHLKDTYPAWDALEILKPHADGTPIGGFCQQFNLVFLQACESLGFVGRVVSIGPGEMTDRIRGGHETVEIWSNQFGKWIYFDGNTAWYAVDEASGVPLSLAELQDRQRALFAGRTPPPHRVMILAETRHQWMGLDAWPPFVELRLVPRSNFLQQKSPLPLNQGMRGWSWTGHYVRSDKPTSDPSIYSHPVRRPGDFNWTLNQAHLQLSAESQPGQIKVEADTVTPGLETLLVSVDDAPAVKSAATWTWQLHPGQNKLRVVPRNTAGREGIASTIVIEWRGKN